MLLSAPTQLSRSILLASKEQANKVCNELLNLCPLAKVQNFDDSGVSGFYLLFPYQSPKNEKKYILRIALKYTILLGELETIEYDNRIITISKGKSKYENNQHR